MILFANGVMTRVPHAEVARPSLLGVEGERAVEANGLRVSKARPNIIRSNDAVRFVV